MNPSALYYGIPDHTLEALDRYVEHGYMPGDFLFSVLSNDLFGAIGRADSQNIQCMKEICQYIYNEIPSIAWGSAQEVLDYSEKKMGLK